MYSKEELEKKIEEFTSIAVAFIAENRPTKELREFVDKLTSGDAFIFGQCCGNIIKPYLEANKKELEKRELKQCH